MSTPEFEVPPSIAALGSDAGAQVAELVRAAEHWQAQEGRAAAESSLGLAPRPLRPLLRKVLGI